MSALPQNLEDLCIERFDELVARNLLFYKPSIPEYITHNGFQFEFRITPILTNKPILSPNAPGRSKSSGPFINPDPNFVITPVGPSHTLELSMYCVLRPALVLHTNEFRLQTEPLNECDFTAIWAVLNVIKSPQILLYNCGEAAGASQGHKHFQVLPKPDDERFEMFLDATRLDEHEPASIPGIQYKHFALAIAKDAEARDVLKQYIKLLEQTKRALPLVSTTLAYNVAATKEWMILIPRRLHYKDGLGANGVGMLGLVWLTDQAERDQWSKKGMSAHLEHLGFPA